VTALLLGALTLDIGELFGPGNSFRKLHQIRFAENVEQKSSSTTPVTLPDWIWPMHVTQKTADFSESRRGVVGLLKL
jgi:hypothetical protein